MPAKNEIYYRIDNCSLRIIKRIQQFCQVLFKTVLNLSLSTHLRSQWREVIWNKKEIVLSSTDSLEEIDFSPSMQGEAFKAFIEQPIKKLKEIYLLNWTKKNSETDISSIENFEQLKNIQKIFLKRNELTTVPAIIGELTNLEYLNISNNNITALPISIGQLKNLQGIGGYQAGLHSLPNEIEHLTNLKDIDLVGNFLTSFPNIFKSTQLENLWLTNNRITLVPDAIGQLTNLTSLQISNNQLTELPETIGFLSKLTTFSCCENQLTHIPTTIDGLVNLEGLNFSRNQISSFPNIRHQMPNIISLTLDHNQISFFPDNIKQLPNLEHLFLAYNQLASLPETINQLTKLKLLDLPNNRLSTLPNTLNQLPILLHLDLAYNQFNTLPIVLSQLPNLITLNLAYNQLTILPSWIYQLPSSLRINLEGNPLTEQSIRELNRLTNQLNYQGPRIIYSLTGLEQPNQLINYTHLSNFLSFEDYKQLVLQLNDEQKNNLNLFLSRLQETRDYRTSPALIEEKAKNLITWLLNEAEQTDKTQAFAILQEATSTCGDKISLSFNHLLLLKKVSQSPNLTLEALKALVIGLKRYELLQQIAKQKCQTLYACDPIEVHLHYEIALKEVLNLPLEANKMIYQHLSNVTEEDIETAKQTILNQTSATHSVAILLNNPIWQKNLEKQPTFAQIKIECESLKQETLASLDTNDVNALEAYQATFNQNEKTIWNPCYLLTTHVLAS